MKKNDEPAKNFTEEWIQVGDLEVDPQIQRDHLQNRKIEHMTKNFNPDALGVIVVSRRNPVTNIVLDGMHRRQVVAEMTDGQGKVLCHVYERLTRREEAQMFLALNYSTQPTQLDKFKVRVHGEEEVAVAIDQITKAFGWAVSKTPGEHSIQAVNALERIYLRSVKYEYEPNLLESTLRILSKAWGHGADVSQSIMLEGMAAFLAEYGSQVEFDNLVQKLQDRKGGPMALRADARQLAATKQSRTTMAVAELITEAYNKRLTTRALPAWGRRA